MFKMKAIVLFEKYLWKSHEEEDIRNFDFFLILMKNGRFCSANPLQGYKTLVHLPDCCQEMFNISNDTDLTQRNCENNYPDSESADGRNINHYINLNLFPS